MKSDISISICIPVYCGDKTIKSLVIDIQKEMKDYEFQVNSFKLMASTLTTDGPVYDVIESYDL